MNTRPTTTGHPRLATRTGSGAGGTFVGSRLIRPCASPVAAGRSANDNYVNDNVNSMGKCD